MNNFVTNTKDPSILEVFQSITDALNKVESIRKSAEDLDLLDTQEYLSFEDELNKISTMDPNDRIQQ